MPAFFYTCRNSHHMLENLCKLEEEEKNYIKNIFQFAHDLTVCILQFYLSYKFMQMLDCVCVWNWNSFSSNTPHCQYLHLKLDKRCKDRCLKINITFISKIKLKELAVPTSSTTTSTGTSPT